VNELTHKTTDDNEAAHCVARCRWQQQQQQQQPTNQRTTTHSTNHPTTGTAVAASLSDSSQQDKEGFRFIVVVQNKRMTRGDQRDRDRTKRQAKEAAKNKTTGRDGTPAQRNQDDKVALLAKLQAKKAAKEAGGTEPVAAGKAPVKPKGKPKQTGALDDLLSAGLSTGKRTRK
jgi:hypothetical protein